jgi:hypothetical protein
MPDQWTVGWETEGQGGHQGPGLDVCVVREDRQVREGHRHESDVRQRQGADNHPALSRCEAGTESKRRAGVAGPTGARTQGTAAASTKCQSWTGRVAAIGSRPEAWATQRHRNGGTFPRAPGRRSQGSPGRA